ncbi:MAG: hypothetical protein VX346_17600 [Planctomycetota bacterium]|nr:hypothetical protein [Planctomycetota bacterium]
MSTENGPSPSSANLQQAAAELARLHDVLLQTTAETTQLLSRLNACQTEQQHALTLVKRHLEEIVSESGGSTSSATPLTFSEREATRWCYQQLEHGEQSETVLLAAFERDFGSSAAQLVTFLSNHRFFRKAGTADTATWMISGNRHDDLRDYLAE